MIPWLSSDSTQAIIPAFVKALAADLAVLKNKDVNAGQMRYKYADLGAVLDALKPVLTDNDLAVSQTASNDGVQTILLHSSGEWLAFPPLHIQTAQGTPQAQGSAISFARRYSLLAAFNIATEDDDAQTAAKKPRTARGPTDAQQKKAQILAKEVGLIERPYRLQIWSEWLDRPVDSFNDLTAQEAAAVIDRMETMKRDGL